MALPQIGRACAEPTAPVHAPLRCRPELRVRSLPTRPFVS